MEFYCPKCGYANSNISDVSCAACGYVWDEHGYEALKKSTNQYNKEKTEKKKNENK